MPLVTAPGPTSAIPRGSTVGAGTGPTPPDPTLAATTGASAAEAAAGKQRKKASTGIDTLRLGTPGTSTVKPILKGRTLLGY